MRERDYVPPKLVRVCVCACACVSTGWENPQLAKSKMSSDTQTPDQSQKLFNNEQNQLKALEKKNARLQAGFEKEKAELQADLEKVQETLELFEADSEGKDATLQDLQLALDNKNVTLRELQKALDDTDRPKGSDGDKKLEDLQARNRLLEGQNRDLELKLSEAYTEILWLREYSQSLSKDAKDIAADTFNHVAEREPGILALESALSVVLQDKGTYNKINNRAVAVKRKADAYDGPKPSTKDVKPQSSNSSNIPPQANTTNLRRKGNNGQVTKILRGDPPTENPLKQGTKAPQEGTGDSFTTPAKNKVAPVNRVPKQESFAEQAASTNSFAAFADKEKPGPKFPPQAKPTEYPSYFFSNIFEDKGGQEADSASRSSNKPKPSKAVESWKSPEPPGPSKTMAQAAVTPREPETNAGLGLMFLRFTNEPPAKSQPTDKMKIHGNSVGKVALPGKPIPKPKRTAPETPKGSMPVEVKGPESSVKPLKGLHQQADSEKVAPANTELAPAGKPVSLEGLEILRLKDRHTLHRLTPS